MDQNVQKHHLWLSILDTARERVAAAEAHLESLRESLGSESKSTAGDKHETGRAMIQQEMERAVEALGAARNMLGALQAQAPASGPPVRWGSWVQLGNLQLVIAQPMGRLATEVADVQVVSPTAPLAQALLQTGAHPGDEVSFNGKTLRVVDVL